MEILFNLTDKSVVFNLNGLVLNAATARPVESLKHFALKQCKATDKPNLSKPLATEPSERMLKYLDSLSPIYGVKIVRDSDSGSVRISAKVQRYVLKGLELLCEKF